MNKKCTVHEYYGIEIIVWRDLIIPAELWKAIENLCIDIKRETPDIELFLHFFNIAERSDRNSRWLKDANYLGLADKYKIRFYIDPAWAEVNSIDFKWLLYHEYRHIQQYNDPVLFSVVHGFSPNEFIAYLCGGKKEAKNNQKVNAVLHAFHEVAPAEVDANVYASQKIGMPYKGNPKFDLNTKMIRWFNRRMKQIDKEKEKKMNKK